MNGIPPEILELILVEVDAKDLLTMRLVTKKMKCFVENNTKIWSRHVRFNEFGNRMRISHSNSKKTCGNKSLFRIKSVFIKNSAFTHLENNVFLGPIRTYHPGVKFQFHEIEYRDFIPWISHIVHPDRDDHVVFIYKDKIEHGIVSLSKDDKMFLYMLSGQALDLCDDFKIYHIRYINRCCFVTPMVCEVLPLFGDGKVENLSWPIVFLKTYSTNCFMLGDLLDQHCMKLQKSIYR